MSVIIPPIKSQGIKTKLIPWINDLIYCSGLNLASTNWIEPFFGTGVVGLNAPIGGNRYIGDSNPHIINFYNCVLNGDITPQNMREYLEYESEILSTADDDGYEYYREVRNRFNAEHSPFDFIFLSRTGFNGMMRFNSRCEWNVPFCQKPRRFSPAYITKICNQVASVQKKIHTGHWEFHLQDFTETISKAKKGDLIYCDPPYFGRYADYYNGWSINDEEALFDMLSNTQAHFILSTWHHNDFRSNEMIKRFWNNFNIETQDHFYHNGGRIENRHAMTEALIFNFDLVQS